VNGNAAIETDYLVVGAGALGMGFVDVLLDRSDADVVMVDRRHRPGGHWLDSYPFVQLHQPSMNYGVNSTPLGQNRIEPDGRDAGFYERASGTEICGYFDEVMRHRLLASGRVHFFPMCDYLGGGRFRSRVTGVETQVTVRERVVDATYMASRVPAVDAPPFAVAGGVTCVPVGQLARLTAPPAGYVIVGGGKTAMDAACWLLDQGTPPDSITWIRPRDAWILNRAYFQPGEGVVHTFEGVVHELEAVAECDSIEAVYQRLEEHEVVLRTDRSIEPTMLKGATASVGELEQLCRIANVVRLGHVERIDVDTITLEQGSIPTSPQHVHVHCASAGLSDNPPKPVFTESTITLQAVTRVNLSLSAGVIAVVEASGCATEEKNRLCRPNPWPHTPFDFVRHVLTGIRTEFEWQGAPDVLAWVAASRLDLVGGLDQAPDKETVTALQRRFLAALGPALANFDELARRATPTERARMYEPAA
jgi:hypothetical protein